MTSFTIINKKYILPLLVLISFSTFLLFGRVSFAQESSNQIRITVNSDRIPPVANDDNATTDEETPVTINILSNDSDSDGAIDASTINILSNPSHGSFVLNSDGSITYEPNPGFSGVDTLTYTVKDNDGDASNIATVSITVNSTFKNKILSTTGSDYSGLYISIAISILFAASGLKKLKTKNVRLV